MCFAGSGPLEEEVKGISNIQTSDSRGESFEKLIREARFSICPSVCYENCPFSVMKARHMVHPVLGADIGGVPELIEVGKTGELFVSGDATSLKERS